MLQPLMTLILLINYDFLKTRDMVLLDIIQCTKDAIFMGLFIASPIIIIVSVSYLIKRRKDKKWEEEYKKFMDGK